MEISSSEPLNPHAMRSRISELSEIHSSNQNEVESEALYSDSEKFLNDCISHLENKVKQITEEYSDVGFLGIEDLDKYLAYLKEELNQVEAESAKISNEIEDLSRNHIEESNILEHNLEGLKCALDSIASQERVDEGPFFASSMNDGHQSNLMDANEEQKFEILELESQIEKNNAILKSLQNLDSTFKRLDALEQIEDALAGLKVIGFDGNCIRLSLQTYIPKVEGALWQTIIDDTDEPSVMNHELLLEIMDDGTMEVKNVEMFPNDVYIGDILDAAKSFRQLSTNLVAPERWSSLEWLVGKVQDRIILSTLRRYIVKSRNKSRYCFEYIEKDETIAAHMVGGIDAFIKVSQGWPLSKSPLKLLSVKSSDHHSGGISLSLLCKVQEMANSLDMNIRQSLSAFADAVEKLLLEQMRLELRSDDASDM
ncbi:Detected protein of unknown function [Hibiscus syriacus]|uniref:Uncharacterized protein n=1 Tax=Hibiscus syriacus TaxID=106335 RepID=A0A6A2W826_HIBSY|nr:uncharacterized protein LOC120197985 [Hibiscus syriacus]KAE8653793.1 Detected protein of unknown function [Hibiscus syriacus]